MREHAQHAGESQGRRRVDAQDLAPGDLARHDMAVNEVRNLVVSGISRCSRHLGSSVDSADRRPDHADASAPAAWTRARTMPRFASSILKSLWPNPRAPRSIASAAIQKFSPVAGRPCRSASTCSSRHGLWATPPRAILASAIEPFLNRRTAATETSANAYEARSRILM